MGRRRVLALAVLLVAAISSGVRAQGQRVEDVKQIPPRGGELAASDRQELEAGVAALGQQIDAVRGIVATRPELAVLLPDVQIYHNSVRYPLLYDEPLNVARARAALAEGNRRAAALLAGKPDWTASTGPRGYVSRIDGSVQPYVLVVPDAYAADDAKARRLDFFCHGRDEGLTELKFLYGRTPRSAGDRFLVNLYGRYCNANKFAGEVDLLEALESMKRRYAIDENRVVVTGFSMGGASCWQFAVHHTDLFAAASPGAGFAETRRYLKLPNGGADLPWYERKLWHWYDCTDYAANLFNLPTIAYAGELDPQKQASDVMEEAMNAEGLPLERLTGPATKHEYHKETKQELDRRLDAYAARGRNAVPPRIRFTTWTLRYNRMYWLTVEGLERHWERARVDADVGAGGIHATTRNVSELRFNFPARGGPFTAASEPEIVLDGAHLRGPAVQDGRPWSVRLAKGPGGWHVTSGSNGDPGVTALRKRHGLQGPIDDAFLDRFTFVLPTGRPYDEAVGRWVGAESKRAIDQWRKQFRGEARVKRDDEVTDADIQGGNLVLWGDPSSNRLLARVADRLPVRWSAEHVTIADARFPAASHLPLFIYPNPLNTRRYIVVNSGFTFRELDYLSNARQVPKLPDYAILSLDVPPGPRSPGRVVRAGFFGEDWQMMPDDGKGDAAE
jgi:hypothetical protein